MFSTSQTVAHRLSSLDLLYSNKMVKGNKFVKNCILGAESMYFGVCSADAGSLMSRPNHQDGLCQISFFLWPVLLQKQIYPLLVIVP